MQTSTFRKIFSGVIILALFVISFLILQPILMSIIFGFILAFILSPVYNLFYNLFKRKNLSATLVCALLILIVVLPLWFLTPIAINQAFKVYLSAQQLDYAQTLSNIFPSLFASEQFSNDLGGVIQSFVIKAGNAILDWFSQLILNFPTILLHLVVILFTLYFALRDKHDIINYLKSLSPFSREVENKLFKSSKDITASVLYGQVIVGIIQGLILAIAFFIFGVPNPLILSALAVILGILPIVGTMFVWIPVAIYLVLTGETFSAIGISIFGLISSNIDNLLRPLFVSRFTQLHSSIVLIGMIGGLFIFGVLGVILGPLVIAYLLTILDVYRNSKGESSPLLKPD